MLAADGLRSLRLMKLFPWASATHIHILAYCDERCFDFGPWLLSVLPSASEMRFAEDKIILDAQRRHFSKEVEALAKADPKKIKRVLNRSGSALRQLDPFVDNKGFLRVGGRLNLCEEAWEVKHPLILPQSDPLVNHLIFACHVDNGHSGIEFVLSELRRRFWILRGR